MVKEDAGSSIVEIYNELWVETQERLAELFQQLLAEQHCGKSMPRTSIIKTLAGMDPCVIQDCIEMYAIMVAEEAPGAVGFGSPGAQADDAQKLPGKTDIQQDVACASVSSESVVTPGAPVDLNTENDETSGAAEVNATSSEAAPNCDDWERWGGRRGDQHGSHSCRDGWSWGAGKHAWPYWDTSSWYKIYVGNLPGGISRDRLMKLLLTISPRGLRPDDIHVMPGRQSTTGQSSALLVFCDPKNAEQWRRQMIGYKVKVGEEALIVKYAWHQHPPGQGGKGKWSSNGKGKGRGKGKSKAYVPVLKMQ